jgi:hypothetical protein
MASIAARFFLDCSSIVPLVLAGVGLDYTALASSLKGTNLAA